jgi:Helix-turn-helix domain
MPVENANQPISGHKGRDQWMCALAAASDLSAMALRLALRLCVFFNCKNGQCDPGYPKLAKEMAVSERSVFRAIAELEAGGWIAVDRTGGNNDRNNQFALLIPSAQVTTVVTRSGDNMMSPEKVSAQVTENGPSGDKNRWVQVTPSVSPLKNLRTCEPEGRTSAARTSDAARYSTPTNSATDGPVTRAAEAALNDHPAAQNQSSPERIEIEMGPPATNAWQAGFERVKAEWPPDRTADDAKAFFACCRALDALGDIDECRRRHHHPEAGARRGFAGPR